MTKNVKHSKTDQALSLLFKGSGGILHKKALICMASHADRRCILEVGHTIIGHEFVVLTEGIVLAIDVENYIDSSQNLFHWDDCTIPWISQKEDDIGDEKLSTYETEILKSVAKTNKHPTEEGYLTLEEHMDILKSFPESKEPSGPIDLRRFLLSKEEVEHIERLEEHVQGVKDMLNNTVQD